MIYIIRSGDYIKVGTTHGKFSNRLASYKTHNPLIEVLNTFDYGTWKMEQCIHDNLHGYERTRKEWYTYSDEVYNLIIEMILAYKTQYLDNGVE